MHDHDSDLNATAVELCTTRLLGLIEEFAEAAGDAEDAACLKFLAQVGAAVAIAAAASAST